MTNILKKYGVWEYIVFLMGLIILSKLTHSFVTDTLENTTLNVIAFLLGLLLLAAPAKLVDLIKKLAEYIVSKKVGNKKSGNE